MTRAFISQGRDRPRECPVCRSVLDAFTGVAFRGDRESPPAEPVRPEPGSLTVCEACRAVLVFTETGFRPARPADLAGLDPEARRWLETIRDQMPAGAKQTRH